MLGGRGLYGYLSSASFLDIGTPEDFAAAKDFFRRLNESQRRRYVVLDRDGTIIEEREYLSQPNEIALISGTGGALRELQRHRQVVDGRQVSPWNWIPWISLPI